MRPRSNRQHAHHRRPRSNRRKNHQPPQAVRPRTMTHRSWSADLTRSPLPLFSAPRRAATVACHNRPTSACGAPGRTLAGGARCARRSSACAVLLWNSTPSRPSLGKSRSSPASWPRCRGRRPSSSGVMRAPRLPSSPAMSAPAPDAGTGGFIDNDVRVRVKQIKLHCVA